MCKYEMDLASIVTQFRLQKDGVTNGLLLTSCRYFTGEVNSLAPGGF